MEAEGGKVGL